MENNKRIFIKKFLSVRRMINFSANPWLVTSSLVPFCYEEDPQLTIRALSNALESKLWTAVRLGTLLEVLNFRTQQLQGSLELLY